MNTSFQGTFRPTRRLSRLSLLWFRETRVLIPLKTPRTPGAAGLSEQHGVRGSRVSVVLLVFPLFFVIVGIDVARVRAVVVAVTIVVPGLVLAVVVAVALEWPVGDVPAGDVEPPQPGKAASPTTTTTAVANLNIVQIIGFLSEKTKGSGNVLALPPSGK